MEGQDRTSQTGFKGRRVHAFLDPNGTRAFLLLGRLVYLSFQLARNAWCRPPYFNMCVLRQVSTSQLENSTPWKKFSF